MKSIGVIPARWASTRFEGKVLAEIAGKPMIQHVWERTQQSTILGEVIIACDEQKVFDAVKGFGAQAVLTSQDHPSGTDRIAEVVQPKDCEIVINIQGDEPLIHHSVIDNLIHVLEQETKIQMATVIKFLEDKDEIENPNIVKVVIDEHKNALYFSRCPIPYNREGKDAFYYKHLGIYAYRKDFLLKFTQLPKSGLEKIEQLEQLRALEAGYKIKTIMTDIKTIGVDTPDDLMQVEQWLK